MLVYLKYKVITTLSNGTTNEQIFSDNVKFSAFEQAKEAQKLAINIGLKSKIVGISTFFEYPYILQENDIKPIKSNANGLVEHYETNDILLINVPLFTDFERFYNFLANHNYLKNLFVGNNESVFNLFELYQSKLAKVAIKYHKKALKYKASDFGGFDNIVQSFDKILGNKGKKANQQTINLFVSNLRSFYHDKQSFKNDFGKKYNKPKKPEINRFKEVKQLILDNGMVNFINALKSTKYRSIPRYILLMFGTFTIQSIDNGHKSTKENKEVFIPFPTRKIKSIIVNCLSAE